MFVSKPIFKSCFTNQPKFRRTKTQLKPVFIDGAMIGNRDSMSDIMARIAKENGLEVYDIKLSVEPFDIVAIKTPLVKHSTSPKLTLVTKNRGEGIQNIGE